MKEAKLDRRVARVPDEDFVQQVQEIYERGQSLDALRNAETFAPLQQWAGVKSCVLAARIAANAGAPRLATKLTLRAWKTAPDNAEALAQYGYELLGRRGPLALWQASRAWQEGADAAEHRAEVLALRGRAAADLRDFANAEMLLARAEAVDPNRPWIRLQHAHFLECQDRVEESLDAARAACAAHRHPFYRAGVQTCAHLLQLLDRDEEAVQLLQDAGAVLQNGPVAAQLYGLLSEHGRWAEAGEALDRFEALSPLLEKPIRRWLDSQRSRIAYHRGKRGEAADLAARLDDDFHRQFAERLRAAPASAERVQLDVTFVRQHFKTCAPATLAAIGRFWGMPAGHLKLAEAMCYDGTPHWQQRDWAERNGWGVREFRVTPECATALIERGLPFAISVVDATSAHMMAVIGFDRTRGTLLLRDPGQPYVTEAHAEEFLKRHRAFGPHGMVFVPVAEMTRLDGLALPEAALHDGAHRFWLLLSRHDRAGAVTALAEMERLDSGATRTWEARLELATYDANVADQARCLDELLKQFPNEPARLLRRLGCLGDGSREERLQFLRTACAAKDADAALMIALGRTLQGDGRCRGEARHWLRRAMRFRPVDSSAIAGLADLLWDEGRLEEATECYRFAANLEGFREHLYQSWFIACRRTRRTDEALAHLQDRFARFGARSEQPALTLAWAWREMEQPARARQVLEESIRQRPDDGCLLLRAAGHYASLGETAEADKLHQAARGKVRENDWLRSRAEIAESLLDFETVLRVSRELLQREPLALDARSAVSRVLARREGTLVALEDLKKACAEFPHHYGLQRMKVEWSREAGPDIVESACRELLRLEPADAWARRELALALLRQQRGEESLREAEEAARIEPGHSLSFSILGHVHRQLGQFAPAREQFRRAVALSVDNEDAIRALLEQARTDKERKEDLAFVEAELIRQVVTGDGLLAYVEIARPLVDAEPLLSILRRAHAERPDLWHAWAALVSQLGHVEQLDEALRLAREAGERFPHLPRIWLELATVHQRRNQPDEEIAACQRAFEINPAWNRSALALAAALERRHRLDDARRVYERALTHSPRDPQLHAAHANLLWRQGNSAGAFAAVEKALRLAPGFEWAWSMLSDWSAQSGEPGRPAEFVRRLTRERSGEMRVWLLAARVLTAPEAEAECLAAIERAIALDPRSTEAWDAKAELLARAERFEEAIRVCQQGVEVCSADTHLLRGRHAWIEACRRRLPDAIALMRAVLTENQSYLWGWHQLALWQLEQGAVADAGTALEQMRRLCPHDAWVNRQLGFLCLKQENHAGARKAFAAALEISPTDAAAAHNLLDLQLRDADLAGAEATLQKMRLHQPGAATVAADLILQLRQKPNFIPRASLETLCAAPDPDPWPVDAAMDAMIQAGQASDALAILKRFIKSGPSNPQLASAVINGLARQGSFVAATWFFLRLKPGEAQRRAADPLVLHLAQNGRRLLLHWLLWRRREVLFRDDATWGRVGFALSKFNRMKQVARWLNDWPQRPNVQPWMLFNYCLALRHAGRYAEATKVARHVVQTWSHREGSADMHLFLAVEAALAGDVPSARDHLKRAVVRDDAGHDQQLITLAKVMTDLQSTPRAERRQRFATFREQMSPHFGAWRLLHSMRDIRRTFRRAGDLFQQQGAGPGAWLWFKWKLHWQWSLLPLAPLAIALAVQPPVLVGLLVWRLTHRRGAD